MNNQSIISDNLKKPSPSPPKAGSPAAGGFTLRRRASRSFGRLLKKYKDVILIPKLREKNLGLELVITNDTKSESRIATTPRSFLRFAQLFRSYVKKSRKPQV